MFNLDQFLRAIIDSSFIDQSQAFVPFPHKIKMMMMIIAKSLSRCLAIKKHKRKLRPKKIELIKKLRRKHNKQLNKKDRTKKTEKSKLERKDKSMKIYSQARKLMNMKRTYKINSRMSSNKHKKEPKK